MKTFAPAIAILLYCSISAFPLFQAWWGSPFERLSGLAFLIWIAPLLMYRMQNPSLLFLIGATLATLLGTLGSLNTLKYLGLAFAIASFAPKGWAFPFWLLSAIAWMPAFGWLSAHFFPALSLLFKIGSVLLTATALSLQTGEFHDSKS